MKRGRGRVRAFLAVALALTGTLAAGPEDSVSGTPQSAATAAQANAPSQPSAVAPSPQPAAPEPAVTASSLASRLKARFSYDPLTGYGLFERGGDRLVFALGLPWALLDWDKALQIDPPSEGSSGLAFTATSADALQKAFPEAPSPSSGHFSVAAILIDPGHGGKDPGAIGEHVVGGKKIRVVEKEVTLAVSKKLYESLKAKYPDKRILVTRDDDSYPTLEDRVEMANSVELAPNEAIIYVSIHANSSFNKSAKGFEIWYLNPEYRRTLVDSKAPGGPGHDIAPILNAMLEEEFTTESIILARDVMTGLQAKVGADSPNRGVRAEEWFVVRNARMPSILIETGFVTNPDEGKLLTQDDYLSRLADGVYNGLVDFVAYFESMRGASSQ
jgi:N-acetylmuramoyl-L-alanine amidase